MQVVLDVVSAMDGARVVSSDTGYIHCEFSTPLFGFIDDVEFLFDAEDSVIHFRSASRAGYYDFGLNRRRMSEIRRRISDATQRVSTASRLTATSVLGARRQLQIP